MSDYVIYEKKELLDSGKPTAHAIVIGVGAYHYLTGGRSSRITKLHGGLGQLSSPPESARAITTWLLDEFNNPHKQLATISLLISDPDGASPFSHPKLAQPAQIKEPTIANVKSAVREWKAYGDRNEDNLVLFFFCGHGVARGLEELSLLLADYGETDDMPMEGAIDFMAMHRGMAQCKASEQCYFIDACRKVSDIATRTTAKGESILQDDINRPWESDWNYAIFFSTLGGEAAHGRKNKPSLFTEVLLKGLKGTGANNRNGEGKWRVATGDLIIALTRGMKMLGPRVKAPMVNQVHFEFHELRGDPIAMAIVSCDPKSNNKLATFYCKQQDRDIDSRDPEDKEWEVIVPYGRYDFIAEIESRRGRKADTAIWPPYQEIKIKVPS